MAENTTLSLSPAQKAEIRLIIKDLSDIITKIEVQRDSVKEAIDETNEKYSLPKGFLRQAIKIYHKNAFDEESERKEEFINLYTSILLDGK